MKFLSVVVLVSLLFTTAYCSKGGSAGSNNIIPTNLVVDAVVNPDNSGNVSFKATATNAVFYTFTMGNGITQTSANGLLTYKYSSSGVYTVTVVAKSSTGQTISTTKIVNVTVTLQLVWSEEFNVDGAPDPTKWGYDLGAGGWGNNELEYYTNRTDNAFVSGGTLKIIAKAESYSGSAYTSARLLSKGKFSFKYGRIDISAKLPGALGTWPALWMLGDNISSVNWPACGEMDIMEMVGTTVNKIYGTLHYPGHSGANGNGATTIISNSTGAFHKYSEIWDETTIKFLVDDVPYFTFSNDSSTPFNQNFFIILNVAMGGNFGGAVDPAFTSDTMEVDYIRVYQ